MDGVKENPAEAANQVPGIDKNSKKTTKVKQVCSDCPLRDNWLQELQILCNRHASMGITPDLASLTLIELWGLYCWLKGLG